MKNSALRSLLVLGTLLTPLACGRAVPPSPAPKAPDFVDDTDPVRARVTTAKLVSAPMVVDWKPENRGDLEVRAKRGPALVRFDEKSFELLPDCEASGGYDYVGMTPKEEHRVWKSRAELYTNIPLSAVELEAKLVQSGALNVHLMMVGQRVLNRPTLARSELKGRCSGATHFVRSLTVGAFRLASAAAGSGKAGVRVLNAGAGAESSGLEENLQVDGEFAACQRADPTGADAPARCAAILQIRLVPLDTSAKQAAEGPQCGEGLEWDGRACISAARLQREAKQPSVASQTAKRPSVAGYECKTSDARECAEQCKVGNFASCASLGLHFEFGGGDIKADKSKAETLYAAACEKGVAKGCMYLGNFYGLQKKHDLAAKYGSKACLAGDQAACTNVAVLAFFGQGMKEDRKLAFGLWTRACKLQDWQACSNAGAVIFNGLGVAQDFTLARQLFERSCNATGHAGCNNLGMTYETGMGGPQDFKQALANYTKTCDQNDAYGCVLAGLLIEEQATDADRHQKAAKLFDRGCGLPETGGSCLALADMKRTFTGKYSADGIERRSCDGASDVVVACYNSAVLAERGSAGKRDESKAKQRLETACRGGLQRACRAPRSVGSQFNAISDRPIPEMATPELATRHVFEAARNGDFMRLAQDAMLSHELFIQLAKVLKPGVDAEKQWQRYRTEMQSAIAALQKDALAFTSVDKVERRDEDGFEVYNVGLRFKAKTGEKNGRFLFARVRGRLYAFDLD